jgi:thiazole synthase ThiGH ThiG subunit
MGPVTVLNLLSQSNRPILPNTAGDVANLQPDPFGLIEAATELVKFGFHVLPYCTEDCVVCKAGSF